MLPVFHASGIIPAYAGNTSCRRSWAAYPWDHPRVCGEHRTLTDENGEPWGSSPRMRGTHQIRDVSADIHGIIPAYAGNTGWLGSWDTFQGDHPRVCGEHHTLPFSPSCHSGSSPRMRGTLQCRVASEGESGIIPAYAGNTFSATPTPTSTGDHPRVCGEHPKAVPLTEASAGSSPRMRGTPERHHVAPRQGGIIPAYAGNTRRSSNAPSPTRDHPRVCGEHVRHVS